MVVNRKEGTAVGISQVAKVDRSLPGEYATVPPGRSVQCVSRICDLGLLAGVWFSVLAS